jgi:predicted DNA-binding protein
MNIAENRSRCRVLLLRTAPEDLRAVKTEELADLHLAREALEKVRSLQTRAVSFLDGRAASISAKIAHHYGRNEDLEPFQLAISEAIRLYASAISLSEPAAQQEWGNLAIKADLAWNYYGKAACMALKLDARGATETTDPLKAVVDYGAPHFTSLPEESRKSICSAFRRAQQLASEKRWDRYSQRLGQAALCFAEALMKKLEYDTPIVLREIETLGLQGDAIAPADEKDILPKIAATVDANGAQSGMDADDVLRLYSILYNRLDQIIRYKDLGEIDGWIDTALDFAEADRCFSECRRLFGDLDTEQRRPCAESAYGLA